jgi:Eukaryotic membrane protein family
MVCLNSSQDRLLLTGLPAVAHALVMVYQLIALNVAINSYDHALLTLLVSNQFVEIKGSVFKKFEKDNLFQITCAGKPVDILLVVRVLNRYRYCRAIHTFANAPDRCFPQPYRGQWDGFRCIRRLCTASELWVVQRQQHAMDHLLCEQSS